MLLLDSIGELAALFERADVVFMGGTLADRGGHNILEPAYFGKPVIVGPHMENFAAIAAEFQARGALERIEYGGYAWRRREAPAGRSLATRFDRRQGARTRDGQTRRGGAYGEEIRRATGEGIPNPLRTLPARLALTPLSWIWRAGHRAQHAADSTARVADPGDQRRRPDHGRRGKIADGRASGRGVFANPAAIPRF